MIPEKNLIDLMVEMGKPGLICLLAIAGGLALSIFIHKKRMGFRQRMATLPLSALPLFIGISGAAHGYYRLLSGITYTLNQGAMFSMPCEVTIPFHDPLLVLILGSAGSAFLLITSTILLYRSDSPTKDDGV